MTHHTDRDNGRSGKTLRLCELVLFTFHLHISHVQTWMGSCHVFDLSLHCCFSYQWAQRLGPWAQLPAGAAAGGRITERSGRRHFHLTELLSPKPRTLLCCPTHTHTHRAYSMCVLAADPSWRLIPPHFLRPLLLSNWSGSEYNYGENHPGLMWGRINGIKKIICWPSGPGAVWGWEGNLKQREEKIGGGLNERADESLWPPRGSLSVPLGDYFPQRSPPQSHLTPAHTLTAASRCWGTNSGRQWQAKWGAVHREFFLNVCLLCRFIDFYLFFYFSYVRVYILLLAEMETFGEELSVPGKQLYSIVKNSNGERRSRDIINIYSFCWLCLYGCSLYE